MQTLTKVYAAAQATGTKVSSAVQASLATVVAMFLLPLVLSILTLRAVADKDSVQNYDIIALIITGSYLIGAVGYVLILRSGMNTDAQLITLLSLSMLCAAILVSTGGAATLAWDAEATIKTILKQ